MTPLISITGLCKSYAGKPALDGLSLDVGKGETVGLLGPNGAGKTTAMRILSGLSPIDAGQVRVAGYDARSEGREIRRHLGVVTQQDGLDSELGVRDNLMMFAYLAGLSTAQARKRADEVLGFFELAQRADDEVEELSGGMKRRLAIARALLIEPQVIILDEPSTGLDPHSRERVWEQLAQLKSRGVTILMSTHYMDEAQVLCDRVAIMDRGRILALDTPDALIRQHAGDEAIEIRAPAARRQAVHDWLKQADVQWREIGAVIRPEQRPAQLEQLQQWADVRVHQRPANLEDVFLGLTGKELVDD